jgi:hypothetical protein
MASKMELDTMTVAMAYNAKKPHERALVYIIQQQSCRYDLSIWVGRLLVLCRGP